MSERARILRRGAFDAQPLRREVLDSARARILRRERLEAEQAAHDIRAQAQADVDQLRARADEEIHQLREAARQQGFEHGLTQAAAERAKIALSEEQIDQRGLARSVDIARLLAERLIGRSIELDEDTVVDLAKVVLAEVRGVRQIRFVTHPKDVPLLLQALQNAAQGSIPISVEGKDELARGDFQLHTDSGVLKASLGERLEGLARALSESLE